MIERGIGYWISPAGEFVPLPPRVSHADVMRELIDAASLEEDAAEAFAVDVNSYAISRGWTRVRIYPGQAVAYVDYGQNQQAPHTAAVRDLVDQLELGEITVKSTDEQGNYISP